jgi:hypothetical protein
MKTKILSLVMIAFLAITSISCSNDDDQPAVTTPAPVAGNGFTWSINGATATKNTTTANYNLQGSAMNLFATPSGTVFEINLTGSTPGTYTLGNGNGFYYNYSATENMISPTSGSVTITSFANNKASGTFTVTGTGVGVTSITGSFTNIGL